MPGLVWAFRVWWVLVGTACVLKGSRTALEALKKCGRIVWCGTGLEASVGVWEVSVPFGNVLYTSRGPGDV